MREYEAKGKHHSNIKPAISRHKANSRKMTMTTHSLILVALCILPAFVGARPVRTYYLVKGQVFCDTCRAGFETPLTTYIKDAKVKLVCRSRESGEAQYAVEATTGEGGWYEIPVSDDRGNDICEVEMVESPVRECAIPLAGRERATVFPTSNNGIASYIRHANNIGCQKDAPVVGCSKVLKLYKEDDD
ncbi:hypothetical protein ACLOJK_013235 [Asimina triloba]